ncbi:hypothetical protein DFH28DRAFT_1124465 [Melampsora americana]|nr:hypothetical protein DFH28DRAFT_1124465 [Melampsora americana]
MISLCGNSQCASAGPVLQKDKRLTQDDDFNANISPPLKNSDHILGSELEPTATDNQPTLEQLGGFFSKWLVKTSTPPAKGSPLILNASYQDGPKVCPRCSGTVYHSEQVLALGKKWHKQCLKCGKFSKALDAAMCERDGTPYCSRFYDQAFEIEAQGSVVALLDSELYGTFVPLIQKHGAHGEVKDSIILECG